MKNLKKEMQKELKQTENIYNLKMREIKICARRCSKNYTAIHHMTDAKNLKSKIKKLKHWLSLIEKIIEVG